MANWGQGAANNAIGWGGGATSSDNGWGIIHQLSFGHPQTNLTGIWQIIEDASAAIILDGGIVEAIVCANAVYTKLL